jgi:hypothetical protein
MKTLGIMALGVIGYLAFSRLSPDAIGMALGLILGLLAGLMGGVVMLIALRSRDRQESQRAEQIQPQQLSPPPIIIIANGQPLPTHGQAQLRQPEQIYAPPTPPRGYFQILPSHDGTDWQ